MPSTSPWIRVRFWFMQYPFSSLVSNNGNVGKRQSREKSRWHTIDRATGTEANRLSLSKTCLQVRLLPFPPSSETFCSLPIAYVGGK